MNASSPSSNNLPPDVSIATRLVATSTTLCVIALTLFTLRMSVRIRSSKFGSDDYFMVVAMTCAMGYYVSNIVAVAYGKAGHIYYLSPSDVSMNARLNLILIPFYLWSVTAIKFSLACLMFRINGTDKLWRYVLYLLIAFLAAFTLALTLLNFLQCRPLRAVWDFSISRDQCISTTRYRNMMYAGSTIFLVTDVLFSLLPIVIIRKIRRPLREKIVVCFLMGLGLVASGAVISKILSLRSFGTNPDVTWINTNVAMWGMVELFLAISATSIPVLKHMAERTLKRMGLLSSEAPVADKTRWWDFQWSWRTQDEFSFTKGMASRVFAKRSRKNWVEMEPSLSKSTEGFAKPLDSESARCAKDTNNIVVTVEIQQDVLDDVPSRGLSTHA